MKIVIAPDSFKECLSAADVAAAIAAGALEAAADATMDLCPMADGGEGTVDAMVAATGGRFLHTDVFGPLGQPMRARFGMLGTSGGPSLPGAVGVEAAIARREGEQTVCSDTAVVEMAAASGLALTPPETRDPTRTTTYGTGQLILAALDAGAREVIVGIGGSATVDGGAGCAQALGVELLDADGEPCVCGLAGGGLRDVAGIDLGGRDDRIADTRIRVACDVTNPLLGANGAARVYAPQKGATPEVAAELDEALAHLARMIREQLGADVADLAGAGAAGGLGAGLVAFAGAQLERGVELIADAVDLRRRLAGADLCITGEGMLDASSDSGKTTVGVAALAAQLGVPTICLCGRADDDAPRQHFAAVWELAGDGVSVRQAIARADELLRLRTAAAVRRFAGAGAP